MLVPVYIRRVNGFTFFEALIALLVLALFMQMGIRWYEEVSAALSARTIVDRFEVLAVVSYEYRLEQDDHDWPRELEDLYGAKLINSDYVVYFGNEGFELVLVGGKDDPLAVRKKLTEEEEESVMQRVLSAMGGAARHTVIGSDSWLVLELKPPIDLNRLDPNTMLRDGSRAMAEPVPIGGNAKSAIDDLCGKIPAISYSEDEGMIECSGGPMGKWRKVDLAP